VSRYDPKGSIVDPSNDPDVDREECPVCWEVLDEDGECEWCNEDEDEEPGEAFGLYDTEREYHEA